MVEPLRQGGHGGDQRAMRKEKSYDFGAGRGDNTSGHSDSHNGGESRPSRSGTELLRRHYKGETAQSWNPQLEPVQKTHAENSSRVILRAERFLSFNGNLFFTV